VGVVVAVVVVLMAVLKKLKMPAMLIMTASLVMGNYSKPRKIGKIVSMNNTLARINAHGR
jgi:hypothetical protein